MVEINIILCRISINLNIFNNVSDVKPANSYETLTFSVEYSVWKLLSFKITWITWVCSTILFIPRGQIFYSFVKFWFSLVLKTIISYILSEMNKEWSILQIFQNKIVTNILEHISILRHKIRRNFPSDFPEGLSGNNLLKIWILGLSFFSSKHIDCFI